YNLLSAHRIPWTDHSVTTALMTMAQVLGNTSNLAGGASGAVQAGAIPKARTVVFDMSDEQPSSFGATVGQASGGSSRASCATRGTSTESRGSSSRRRRSPTERARNGYAGVSELG